MFFSYLTGDCEVPSIDSRVLHDLTETDSETLVSTHISSPDASPLSPLTSEPINTSSDATDNAVVPDHDRNTARILAFEEGSTSSEISSGSSQGYMVHEDSQSSQNSTQSEFESRRDLDSCALDYHIVPGSSIEE